MLARSAYVRISILLLLLLCFSSASYSQDKPAEPVQDKPAETAPDATIILPEGTALPVVTTKEISSKTANLGDTVDFKVVEDVVVNGRVLISNGTAAKGSVMNAEPSGSMGHSGKLGVVVESTTTVDGKPVKLRAAKGKEGNDKNVKTALLAQISPFFLFKKGGDAKIPENTRVVVYVAEEKRFRLEGDSLVAVALPAGDQPANNEPATVYIYRPNKMYGGALEPSVFVDDKELARMDNGRYFFFKMAPGKHIIHMTDEKKGYAIDMGPGQTYYFRVGIESGMWKGHGKLVLDEEQRAVAEIKKIKFIGKDKIKDHTMIVPPEETETATTPKP